MRERHWPFPAFPNGWFQVAYSDELGAGGVEPLEVFGRDLVLFRDGSGAPRILDAHCRHLGAHMGYGGEVAGDGLRCPFHGWLWNGDGACTEIPYAAKIPKGARIGSWPVHEVNGLVYLWHHAEGEAPGPVPPAIDEVGSESWTPFTKLRWKVGSRMYDMGENAVDHVHFKYLHGASGAPTLDQKTDEDGNVSNYSEMEMTTPKGPVPGSIESRGFGPGLGMVRVKGVVDTIILNNSTPIDEEHVDVRFSYMQRRTEDLRAQRIGEAMLRDLKKQMEQDIVVFEHKRYWTKPLLVAEDGPIGEYRRRARKHYSGSFASLEEAEREGDPKSG
jgi:phenylpropionate dioxygenase-like ring-hydroxylating dioxygenase large terminal subunit